MRNKFQKGLLSIFVLLIISGCVSKRSYEALEQNVLTLEDRISTLTEENDKLNVELTTMNLAKENAVLSFVEHYDGKFSENDYYLFQMFQGRMYLLNADPETVNFIENETYLVTFDSNLTIQHFTLASDSRE
ncbi:hypothetical protein [Erysipelothrix anatis]|uniref:hypothetical protein n=1 Tax=Erysipelothrix anatis TaxID=2683713 RepID=UPI00140A9EDB|nr:hypothetical protein [Erysipelothrix anatis]